MCKITKYLLEEDLAAFVELLNSGEGFAYINDHCQIGAAYLLTIYCAESKVAAVKSYRCAPVKP